jgi:hypothetical protein
MKYSDNGIVIPEIVVSVYLPESGIDQIPLLGIITLDIRYSDNGIVIPEIVVSLYRSRVLTKYCFWAL